MVALSTSSHFYQFTIYYSETGALGRILAAAQQAGAEPAWAVARVPGKAAYRLDVPVGGLSPSNADALQALIAAMPHVIKVNCTRSSAAFT